MRLLVRSLGLIGAERTFEFEPGLNIILGPITTGKTSLIRLCRVLLGGGVGRFPPEIHAGVQAVAGELEIGGARFNVVRRMVSTPTAPVEIAGDGEALRLPVSRASTPGGLTYGRWLLQQLQLPTFELPTRPTRPAESDSVPISINDYMLYCYIPQDDIDSSVFGHRDPFKDIKRKQVFEVIYEILDVEAVRIQKQLREVESRLRQLATGGEALQKLLVGTPWENRAVIEHELTTVQAELADVERSTVELSGVADTVTPRAQKLRSQILVVDNRLEELSRTRTLEEQGLERLRNLANQLELQATRLTRSVVAKERLLDFDFKICPRCGSTLQMQRAEGGDCYVCLQPPALDVTRGDLLEEQDRVATQLQETGELVRLAEERASQIQQEVAQIEETRRSMAAELDFEMRIYVSDSAGRIAEESRRRAELLSRITQLSDYLSLYETLNRAAAEEEELARRKEDLDAALEQAVARDEVVEEKIESLEEIFRTYVDALGTPEFPGEPRASINRRTYLPIINGREFDELSSGGLKVLANVAHAFAHHEAAVEMSVPLPGILLVDSLTKNVGRDEYDDARVRDVFRSAIDLAERLREDLQIIVVANDVPEFASPYVRVRLSERDRLIPVSE